MNARRLICQPVVWGPRYTGVEDTTLRHGRVPREPGPKRGGTPSLFASAVRSVMSAASGDRLLLLQLQASCRVAANSGSGPRPCENVLTVSFLRRSFRKDHAGSANRAAPTTNEEGTSKTVRAKTQIASFHTAWAPSGGSRQCGGMPAIESEADGRRTRSAQPCLTFLAPFQDRTEAPSGWAAPTRRSSC